MTPTIRIRDNARKKASSRKDPSVELREIKAEIAELRRQVADLPPRPVREEVLDLIERPRRYEKHLSPGDFFSKIRAKVRFWESYKGQERDDYEEQPALVEITWRAGGTCYGLNKTEVRKLEKKGFRILEIERGKTYFHSPAPYYIHWLEKKPKTIWFSVLMDDNMGPSWGFCVADHIWQVRDRDTTQWTALTPLNHSMCELAPDEVDDIQGMIRESQAAFMSNHVIAQTLPWEIRSEKLTQSAMALLRAEARRMVQSSKKVEAQVRADAARLNSLEMSALPVLKKRQET